MDEGEQRRGLQPHGEGLQKARTQAYASPSTNTSSLPKPFLNSILGCSILVGVASRWGMVDPGTLISVILALAKELLKLVCGHCKSQRATSRAALQLKLFHDQLTENVRYVEDKLVHLSTLGVSPEPLSALLDELADLLCEAEDLLKTRFSPEQVRDLRERVIDTFQRRMLQAGLDVIQAVLDLECKNNVRVKAIQDMLCQHNVALKAIQDMQCQICRDLKAKDMQRRGVEAIEGSIADPTEAILRYLQMVLGVVRHCDLAATSTKCNSGDTSGAAGLSIKEDVPAEKKHAKEPEAAEQRKEEERRRKEKEDVEGAKQEQERIKEEERKRKSEREEAERKRLCADNPNHLMMLVPDDGEGQGQVQMYKCDSGDINVTIEGAMDVKTLIGERPMAVMSTGLEHFYFYFEVTLAKLVPCGSSGGHPGVGVGFARDTKELRMDKMVGRYRKSIGYDGTVGLVYCEKHLQPFRIGQLEVGDTLGIGLLQLNPQPSSRPHFFLAKNGDLQGFTQHNSLSRSSAHLLRPVVSVSSCSAMLYVNFNGPFLLSPTDLISAAAALERWH